METSKALDYICSEAKKQGADSFDVIAGESESSGLDLYEGKVKNSEISSSRGIGIRLFVDNRPGFAFTEKYSTEALSQTVSDAIAHAKLTDPVELDMPEPADIEEKDLKLWNQSAESVELSQLKDLCLEMESLAQQKDKRVENIPYLGAGKSSGRTEIRNSNGVSCSARGNSLYAGIGVLAHQNGHKKMGYYSNSSRDFNFFKSDYMANLAVERAVEMLGAKSIPSGKYPVVLSKRITPQLIGMYRAPFYGEAVQKGQSRLKGKIGESIAVKDFSILCDPHVEGFPGSRLFDGEGIPSQKISVVENGVLNAFLYNLESAKKEGVAPSGHAVRSYSGDVGTGFSNLFVPKGKHSLSELLSAHPKCLYVTQLEGGSGCSPISGEISIGAQGFWVENGQKVHPVEGVTISSNYFDLIQNIEMFGNEYSDILSSTKVPDMLIKFMYVAG